MIKIEDIKKLREKTGLSVMECREALLDSKSNFEKAKEILKEKGFEKVLKKADRKTENGIIEAYTHHDGKIGVLLELLCETDFVAKNKDFQEFAHLLAMHIAAMSPRNIDELLEQEFVIARDHALVSGEKVKGFIDTNIRKFGENIKIKRFIRWELGE